MGHILICPTWTDLLDDEMDEQIHDEFHSLSLGFNIVAKLVYNCQTKVNRIMII